MRYLSTCVFLLGLGFVISGLSGCGENYGNTVSGTVKNSKGEPIAGEIIFIDKNGKETRAGILDGKYTATKVTAGANDILIKGPPGGVAPAPGATTGVKEGPTAGDAAKIGVPPIAKYGIKGALTLEVASGKNEKDFVLDDK